jgi:hypothetical protein
MNFQFLISFFTFIYNLESIYSSQLILDGKTYIYTDQDVFPLNYQGYKLDQYTITFFVRLKSYVTAATLENPRNIFLIGDPNFNKIQPIYTKMGNVFNFSLKINDEILYTESIQDLSNSIYNWYFFSITYQNNSLFWYIENSTKNFTLSSKQIKNVTITSISNNSIIINPLRQNLGLEISKLIFHQDDALDFYSNPILKLSNSFMFPKDCDADCSNCDNSTGECKECSSGSIPINNKCAPNYVNFTEFKYFNGSFNSSINYHIKSKLKSSIKGFNSFSYTLTFWIRTMSKNTTISSLYEQNYVYLYSTIFRNPNVLPNTTFPIGIRTTKDTKYLHIRSSIHNYSPLPLNLKSESWYFIAIGFEGELNTIRIYIRSNCPYQPELVNNVSSLNGRLDPINELTYLSHNFGNFSEIIPLYGIISNMRLYYNSFLSLSYITSIYSI